MYNSQMIKNSQKYLIQFFIIFTMILITSFVIFQQYNSKNSQENLSKQRIIQEAQAHFQSIQDTRLWNAQFGGVYVKQQNGIVPNPYLKNNVMQSENNETLVKINPAWMTRQISEISNKNNDYQFKITSLNPLNPNNKANKFEQEALKFFDSNKSQHYYYKFDLKNKRFNLMGALTVKEPCLRCHKIQGYKIGDIRGGIRVSVPINLYTDEVSMLEKKAQHSVIFIFITGIIVLMILLLLVEMFYKRQYQIENMNEILEGKVSNRTKKLELLISHEQYIKDILKMITEVNEIIISSDSIETILKNCINKLSKNKFYTSLSAVLLKGTKLDVVTQIFLTDTKIDNDFLSENIQKSISYKSTIIEKIPNEKFSELKWLALFPLIHVDNKEVYGALAISSRKDNGFEPEEVRILENMINDISIAFDSNMQRNLVLGMEKEKNENYEETILAFVNIIEQRDTYTAGHTIRVAEYCSLIAKEMRYDISEIHKLEKAAILHDIGKVATPDAILLKPGKLTPLEYELIKQHSAVGEEMLKKIDMYKGLANIIKYHHSRYDGKGYPRTDSPDEIPMLSHIMIVADSFDAMTTNRIYKPRKSIEEALLTLKQQSGMQFHPVIVNVALKVLKDVKVIDTTQIPTSELEERRMSYFFHDSLTGLYNEDYLLILLNSSKYKFKTLNIIDIHNFSAYNQKHGWKEGNHLLQSIAELLANTYNSSTIIRYHGDDFIILDKEDLKLDIEKIQKNTLFSKNLLTLDIRKYKIDKNFTYENFLLKENR